MKFDFDEYSFQEEISFMHLNYKMEKQQLKANSSLGFNEDTLYNKIENK